LSPSSVSDATAWATFQGGFMLAQVCYLFPSNGFDKAGVVRARANDEAGTLYEWNGEATWSMTRLGSRPVFAAPTGAEA
jgi:hypothetical protein